MGSNANNGTNAGPFYWNANNAASNTNANISGQLCFIFVLAQKILASWQKI